jgi:cytochrome c peroxidase
MIRSTKTNQWAFATLITAILGGIGLVQLDRANSAPQPPAISTPQQQPRSEAEPITPLPLSVALDNRKVELGRRLFHDAGLSADGSVSCANCHNLAVGGVDRLAHSRGIGGKEGAINAPTVFNSGFSFRQFWDGRTETLEEQVDGPLQHPAEMGATWPQVITTLSKDPAYRAEFSAIYRDSIQPHNIRDAIATFERSLVTPNSRFDRFLRGDRTALNEKEQAGYRLFKKLGCTSCHQGINIGGNMYQKLGIMEDYFTVRGNTTEADLGRFSITKREGDRHVFKVPSLRNIALTMPYLHDGSAMTLEDVVRVMARYQLGEKLNTDELEKIVAFLQTLTGEYQGKPLE